MAMLNNQAVFRIHTVGGGNPAPVDRQIHLIKGSLIGIYQLDMNIHSI